MLEIKIPPDEALRLLMDGNDRFYKGKATHENTTLERLKQAEEENQKDHAYATVITCSDSRVPVERIFDVGVMDVFVIRVAGGVIMSASLGSVEYGIAHVHTPVLIVLGHTLCGAVTAAVHTVRDDNYPVEEKNIIPLIENILPAVKKVSLKHPGAGEDDIIPLAIEEHVWHGIEIILRDSPVIADLLSARRIKVVGAIYDIGTGRVSWLPEEKVQSILNEVK